MRTKILGSTLLWLDQRFLNFLSRAPLDTNPRNSRLTWRGIKP